MASFLSLFLIEWLAAELVPAFLIEIGFSALVVFDHVAEETTARPPLPVPRGILSTTRGRIRLAVAGLRGNAALADRLHQIIASLPGVISVQTSTVTGNALILFQEDKTSLETICELAQAVRAPRWGRLPQTHDSIRVQDQVAERLLVAAH